MKDKNQPKTLALHITKVEQRNPNYGIVNFKPARYARVSHTKSGICLYVEAVDNDGQKFHFFTPQTVIDTTDGMLMYSTIRKNPGNFFKEIKGELKAHKSCFEGDQIMPTVISDSTKIVPSFSVGENVEISYKISEIKYGSIRLKSTQLIATI